MEIKFVTPNCMNCTAMTKATSSGYEVKYCTGFPGKKRKRLPWTGLKRSVTPWCPKLICPPKCNILGFIDENQAIFEQLMNFDILAKGQDVAYPMESRYKQRCTVPLEMGAKMFWDEVHTKPLNDLFPDICFMFGEIVEIDDGFKPYYFYYAGDSKFLPTPLFNGSKIQR